MNVGAVLAILLALGLVAGAGGGSAPAGTAINRKGMQDVKRLAAQAGLDEDYQNFLVFVAFGESRGNNLVGLGDPALFPPWTVTHTKWVNNGRPVLSDAQRNEARAATKGYDNSPHLHGCWPRSGYVFGSGGWFGFLPSTALSRLRNTELRCQHPFTVFDPASSIVYAMLNIRGLQQRGDWDRSPKNVWALRVGWGLPSAMDDPTRLAQRRKKYENHLRALGIPTSFLDKKLPPLGSFDPVALHRALGGLVWLPGGEQA